MHEISIIEETLAIALENAHQQDATQIHRLKMRIGEMSGVVPEALNFAFDVVVQGTIAQQAILEIEIVPVKCYCDRCQLEFKPLDYFYQCPQCGELQTQTLCGREIELASLEVS